MASSILSSANKNLSKNIRFCKYVCIGLWPEPKWVGYRLNVLLKTGFTTNRFYWCSFTRAGPDQTRQIFTKWAENIGVEIDL
jgi:hypothetical protein